MTTKKNKTHTQNGCCCREELGNNTSTPRPLVLKFIFFFLATLQGMSDLSSQTRNRSLAPCSGSTES